MRSLALVPFLLALLSFPAAAQPGTPIGTFRYIQRADPITDEDESIVALVSRVVEGEPRAALAWSCFAQGIRAQIHLTGIDVSLEDSATWRFDRARPVRARLVESSQAMMVTLDTIQYYDFTHAAQTASLLVMRVRRADGLDQDLYFDLEGGARALNRLPCVRNLPPPLPAPMASAGGARQGYRVGGTHEVRMVGTNGGASGAFAPAQVYVQRGDTVRFVSDGAAAFNVSFPAALNAPGARLPPAGPYLTAKGQSWSLVIDLPPGQYRFQSDPQAAMGMRGELFVFDQLPGQ
jgi:plastocyanin